MSDENRLVLDYRIKPEVVEMRERMLDRARRDLTPGASAAEICERADAYHRHVLGMDDPYIVRHWRNAKEAVTVSGSPELDVRGLTASIVNGS